MPNTYVKLQNIFDAMNRDYQEHIKEGHTPNKALDIMLHAYRVPIKQGGDTKERLTVCLYQLALDNGVTGYTLEQVSDLRFKGYNKITPTTQDEVLAFLYKQRMKRENGESL